MAYPDPTTVLYLGTTYTTPRVSFGENSGRYRYDSGAFRLDLSMAHTYGKRTRRVLRLDHSKLAVDPYVPANYTPYSMSAYMVVDVPTTGYTPAEQLLVVDSLTNFLTRSTSADAVRLLSGQS